MAQEHLFHGEHLPLRIAYHQLFQYLPCFPTESAIGRGRPAINRDALLRALIYRALRRFAALTDLVRALQENPSLLEAGGLDPLGAVPSVERFSDWLHVTDNAQLQSIRIELLRSLFAAGVFSGRVLALDSCPILSPVRENNLKTAVRDRFNKQRYPQADPTARLGVLASYARPESRKVIFFWGYRNHAVVDTETGLPLWGGHRTCRPQGQRDGHPPPANPDGCGALTRRGRVRRLQLRHRSLPAIYRRHSSCPTYRRCPPSSSIHPRVSCAKLGGDLSCRVGNVSPWKNDTAPDRNHLSAVLLSDLL